MKVLDLNPPALRVRGADPVPGLSALENGQWIHGVPAFNRCRIDPQSVAVDVWGGLSVDGPSPGGGMRHTADLALAQLKALPTGSDPSGWLVCTPSHWDRTQNRVFLGVAEALKLSVKLLVPRALAVAVLRGEESEEVEVWEQDWTGLTRADVRLTPVGWSLGRVERVPEGGVLDLFRRESRVLSRLALERLRVDPLDTGTSEQALFEAWWNHHNQKAELRMVHAGQLLEYAEDGPALREAHANWWRKHAKESGGKRLLPRLLARALGLEPDPPEADILDIGQRVSEPETPGPHWRTCLKPLVIQILIVLVIGGKTVDYEYAYDYVSHFANTGPAAGGAALQRSET